MSTNTTSIIDDLEGALALILTNIPALLTVALAVAFIFFKWHEARIAKDITSSVADFTGQGKAPGIGKRDMVLAKRLGILTDQNKNCNRLGWHKNAQNILSCVWAQRRMSITGYARALLIAFVYPIITAFAVWAVTGSAVVVGEGEVLPAQANTVIRLGVLLNIALVLVTSVWAYRRIKHVFKNPISNSKKLRRAIAYALPTLTLLVLLIFLLYTFNAPAVATALVTFVGAAAVAGVVAVAVAGVVAGAGAGAVAVAATVAAAGVATVAAAVAAAAAAVGAVLLERYPYNAQVKKRVVKAWGICAGYILFCLVIPYFLRNAPDFDAGDFSGTSPLFVFMLVFTLLPVINAAFDWLSVSATQYLLARYCPPSTFKRLITNAWLFALDVGCALLMLVGLYATILGVIYVMQVLGWGVAPLAWLQSVVSGAGGATGGRTWLILLAITNLAPTFVHLTVFLFSTFCGRWYAERGLMCELVATLQNDGVLHQADAVTLARYLHSDGFYAAIFAFLTSAFILYGVYVFLDTVLLGDAALQGVLDILKHGIY